jgi:hypothetical protein
MLLGLGPPCAYHIGVYVLVCDALDIYEQGTMHATNAHQT